jgi:two-component system alkaline phosphatase synthesis response regulator PhoP
MNKKNYKYKLLLIEDEDNIRNGLKLNLKDEGFDVKDYKSAEDFFNEEVHFLENFPYDLAIIDVMLPGKIDGLKITKQIKARWDIPVIILTARNRLENKLEAFEIGVDDYITKPFELEELIARIKVKLKKKKFHRIKIGNSVVDFHKQEILKLNTNEIIKLTNKEAGILYLLYENKGKPVSRDQILDKLWYGEYPTNRTIDNFILRLRKFLEEDPSNPKYIITRHSKGYELIDSIEVVKDELL